MQTMATSDPRRIHVGLKRVPYRWNPAVGSGRSRLSLPKTAGCLTLGDECGTRISVLRREVGLGFQTIFRGVLCS